MTLMLAVPLVIGPLTLAGLWYVCQGTGVGSLNRSLMIWCIAALSIMLSQSIPFWTDKEYSQDLALFLVATRYAPEVEGLSIYLSALQSSRSGVRDQAEEILTLLLPRLSEEQLAGIDAASWRYLCPSTAASAANRYRGGPLDEAVFDVVKRLRRLEALPYIEWLMKTVETAPYSASYRTALEECYRTLQETRESRRRSATLLRASAAPNTSETLLRPHRNAQCSEAGEQLLRAGRADTQDRGDTRESFDAE